ncbi:Predicted peroxiredoxin [Cohaesibacter sp. ES.047]|uniref:DsrE family protein n=1 Tax=Cohaesibacter sp. ES.047 TaxID=1798205 RepID=UPI000BB6EEBB|nr:DsrE family protein [Cohaesibacter sp. ES.047]SNY93036.1 Predicted peroxiredoxin [Cohaesibacter sp. ES.047]
MATQTDYVSTLFSNIDDPNKITVAFTMGVEALNQGHSATIMLMVDAVHLAKPGTLDPIDIGAPFKPAKEMQEAFLAEGGQILVCKACMVHNGVGEDEIDPRFTVISAPEVIPMLMGAKGSLQLT